MVTLQSHQLDIHAYANSLKKELKDTECPFEWVANQLELKTWTAKDGSWKAELLLTFGGPTVTIELDSRFTYGTLNHSWGVPNQIDFENGILRDVICEIRGLE